jgi:ribonuclease HI
VVPAVGKIGAAAVLFVHGRKVRSLKYFLGTESEHTVPEAEAMALILGLELLNGERGVRKVSMAADNMGAVLRSDTSRAAPMQYIWDLFRRQWGSMRRRFWNLQLTIRWVPGHEGVKGNEEADRLARLAVERGSSARDKLLVAPQAPPWQAGSCTAYPGRSEGKG